MKFVRGIGRRIINNHEVFRPRGNNWFLRRGKPEYPEKNLSVQSREPTNSTPNVTPNLGIDPGPHWWETSALTAAPFPLFPSMDLCHSVAMLVNDNRVRPPSLHLVCLEASSGDAQQKFSVPRYSKWPPCEVSSKSGGSL